MNLPDQTPKQPTVETKLDVYDGVARFLTEIFSHLKKDCIPTSDLTNDVKEVNTKYRYDSLNKIDLLDKTQVQALLESKFFSPEHLTKEFWTNNLEVKDSFDVRSFNSPNVTNQSQYCLKQLQTVKEKLAKRLSKLEKRRTRIEYGISTLLGSIIIIFLSNTDLFKAKPVGAIFTPSHISQVQSNGDLEWYMNNRTPFEVFFNNPPTEQEIKQLKKEYPNANNISKVVVLQKPLDINEMQQQTSTTKLSQETIENQEGYRVRELAREIKQGWLNMGVANASKLKFVCEKNKDGFWTIHFFL